MPQSTGHERQEALRTAKIVFGDDNSCIDCAILSSSDRGVCLLVASAEMVPAEFDLILRSNAERYSCSVVSRSQNKVRVRVRRMPELE
jgi:hypothetical protein